MQEKKKYCGCRHTQGIRKWTSKLKREIRKAPLEFYVVFSLFMIIVFTIAMLVLFCLFQSVPDQLIICYFSCFGGECLMCAIIKAFKLKGENDDR